MGKTKIQLKAYNNEEKKVKSYLESNASDELVEKINTTKKTLSGFMQYASNEAKKLVKGSNCACIDDATVFGWAVHYFEEDSIKEGVVDPKPIEKKRPKAKTVTKPTSKKTQQKVEKSDNGQLSIFDFMG